ncbi:Hsp20/alpha crystallin family protein, partial [Streptomyces resistomycificus]
APVLAVLDIPAGHIRFIAADRADTTVEIRPADAAKNRDVKAAEQVSVEYVDGVLRIEATPAKNRILGSSSGSIEVTVQLPAGSRVEAKTAAGEFRGVGRLGDLTFEGAQGSVKVDEAAAARLNL